VEIKRKKNARAPHNEKGNHTMARKNVVARVEIGFKEGGCTQFKKKKRGGGQVPGNLRIGNFFGSKRRRSEPRMRLKWGSTSRGRIVICGGKKRN